MALTKERNRTELSPSDAYLDMLIMASFLDMLSNDADAHPTKLIPYTQQMMDEEDELLSGVTVDQ